MPKNFNYFLVLYFSHIINIILTFFSRVSKEIMNPFTSKPLVSPEARIPSFIPLVLDMIRTGIPLFKNFNDEILIKKYNILCTIMGLRNNLDIEPLKYQITVDNALKLVAIYLRFVSQIPVVIMGETGCGKTRLIRFLADLFRYEFDTKQEEDILIHVKVHGGMSAEEIEEYVEKAEIMARRNVETCVTPIKITCILFFDEANTTEHVGLIKEIMCDNTVNGRKIEVNNFNLKISNIE